MQTRSDQQPDSAADIKELRSGLPQIVETLHLQDEVDISRWSLLIIAFFTGLSIDFFSGVLGIHAAATVFLAFVRPGIINAIGLKEDIEPGLEPTSANFGVLWFLTYATITVFLHHFAYFLIEAFRFSELPTTLLRAFISSLSSVVLIFIIQFLFVRRKS